MRVGLVCPYSWSTPGGVQSHVRGLARALRSAGHEAEILAPADGHLDEADVVPLGRSVGIPTNASVQRVALSPAAVARTARAVRDRGYDLLHLHEPMLPAVCLTAIFAARVPLVGTFHMSREELRFYRLFRPVVKRALARLDGRIAVSEAARAYVHRAVIGDYEVIPNGIELRELAALQRAPQRNRILFVGRPEPRKGLAVLLAAFQRLPADATLELVGPTERAVDRSAVTLAPAERRRILARGPVSDAERLEALARADILCAPSLGAESFGLVLVEAMAAGVPVVASAIPGYVDVLRGSGRLVQPGDAGLLARALAELLADETERQRLTAAGRVAAAEFDWGRVVERVLEVYRDAIERP